MTNTKTSVEIIEKRENRVWSNHNPSLVNRIGIFWTHRSFTPGKMILVRRMVGEAKTVNKFQYQIQQAVMKFYAYFLLGKNTVLK